MALWGTPLSKRIAAPHALALCEAESAEIRENQASQTKAPHNTALRIIGLADHHAVAWSILAAGPGVGDDPHALGR